MTVFPEPGWGTPRSVPLTAPRRSPVAVPSMVLGSAPNAPKFVISIPPTGTQRRSEPDGRPGARAALGFPPVEASQRSRSTKHKSTVVYVILGKVIVVSL